MRTSLIALSCGLAAAAAAIVLVLREGGEPRETRLATASPPSAGAAMPAPGPRATPVPTAASRGPMSTPTLAAAARNRPSVAAPAATPTAPASAPDGAPRRAVFALSSDHQALVQDALLANADHERLEHETRDDAWATEAERLIRQELARQGRALDFDVIAVDCRQTLCAIEAVGYGENGQREWVAAMDEAFRQTLGSVFTSINTAFPTEGSRGPVLTFLHRRPPAAAGP